MIAFRNMALSCAVLAFGLTSAAGNEDAAAREKARAIRERIQQQPMIFFLAKGGPNSCGPGCSEWIAAEGKFDPGAPRRLRDFLASLNDRNRPIFFNSSGGMIGQARAVGSILRERRMSAGVGRTIPEGCRSTVMTDETCRRLMQSRPELKAQLLTAGAVCHSACVFALIGASARQVGAGAQIGIHSPYLPLDAPPERIPTSEQADRVDKRYVVEMGVDPGLVDAIAAIPYDRPRIMTRDEITRFGIETRGFYETAWMPYEDPSKRIVVLKSITQAKGTDGKAYRTSNIRVSCIGAGFGTRFEYRRELAPNEVGVATVIRVAAGDGEFVLRGDESRGGDEQRGAIASWEVLRNAMAAPSIVIIEAFSPQGDTQGWSHVVKLSTKGLSTALEKLQKECGGPKAPAVPVGR
jgi:hypothetical protein